MELSLAGIGAIWMYNGRDRSEVYLSDRVLVILYDHDK